MRVGQHNRFKLILMLLALPFAPSAVCSFSNEAYAVTATFSGTRTQTGRVFRDGTAPACPSKAFPGVFNPGTTFNFETFTYTNSGGAQCVTFDFDPNAGSSPCGTNAHLSIYLGSYDPSNQAANFLQDAGSSLAGPVPVEIPAGGTVVLVVTNTSGQAQCSFSVSPTGGAVAAQGGASSSERAAVAIRNFMVRRADIIAGNQINTHRFHRRLGAPSSGTQSLPVSFGEPDADRRQAAPANDVDAARSSFAANPGAGAPAERGRAGPLDHGFTAVQSVSSSGGGALSFDTSLSDIRAANASRDASLRRATLGVASGAGRGSDSAPTSPFDVWMRGRVVRYSAELGGSAGKQEGPSYILQAGADYIVHPGVLLGVLAQVDWLDDTSETLDTRVEGRGWMAGPYISVGLAPNLFFDARASWGRSGNTVHVGQDYTAFFDTERWLASGMLTGHWSYENWRFSPNAEVVFFQERQDALTDLLGNRIGAQSVSLGRVIFGPDIGYRLGEFGNVSVDLQFALKGVFDFERDQLKTSSGLTAGTDDFRGKVEAGFVLGSAGGASLVAIGTYDGIGSDDYQAWGGRLEGRLPLTGR